MSGTAETFIANPKSATYPERPEAIEFIAGPAEPLRGTEGAQGRVHPIAFPLQKLKCKSGE